jgi:hypothetical protein
MVARMKDVLVAGVVAAALAVGAREALAGGPAVRTANCPAEYNWCAPSLSGDPDANCDECCQAEEFEGGFCNSYAETENQGCICIG